MVPPDALNSGSGGSGAGGDGADASRPPLRLRRRLSWIGAGLGAWIGFRILMRLPDAADVLVGSGPLPAFTGLLSRVTGAVPFSLAEAVIVAVVARQGIGAVRGIRETRRSRDRWRRTLLRGGLRLGQDAGVLLLLFYLLWGFQYARPELTDRLGLDARGDLRAEELEPLARSAVEAANAAYLELHGVPDAGTPTSGVAAAELVPALEVGWDRVRSRLEVPPGAVRAVGAPRPWLASALVRRMGIAGTYFPYTGEALFVAGLPTVRLGTTLAHEMAHQRGVASEADANALAFLVARHAPDPRVRYSGYVFLQGQMVSALSRVCTSCAREVAAELVPGVRRDLEDLARFWEPARGVVGRTASRLNDSMLRSHGIEEGTASYAGSRWILAALALRDGPDVLFGAPGR